MELNTENLPPTDYAEKRFQVMLNKTPMFILGVHRWSLFGGLVYVTLEPLEGLFGATPKQLRFLRDQFSTLIGYRYFCQVEENDTKAARFAEFFGFKYDSTAYGRKTFIREDLQWPK